MDLYFRKNGEGNVAVSSIEEMKALDGASAYFASEAAVDSAKAEFESTVRQLGFKGKITVVKQDPMAVAMRKGNFNLVPIITANPWTLSCNKDDSNTKKSISLDQVRVLLAGAK